MTWSYPNLWIIFIYHMEKKVNELQQALKKIQTGNTRFQEDILEVSRKLQDAYKNGEDYWQQKSRNIW